MIVVTGEGVPETQAQTPTLSSGIGARPGIVVTAQPSSDEAGDAQYSPSLHQARSMRSELSMSSLGSPISHPFGNPLRTSPGTPLGTPTIDDQGLDLFAFRTHMPEPPLFVEGSSRDGLRRDGEMEAGPGGALFSHDAVVAERTSDDASSVPHSSEPGAALTTSSGGLALQDSDREAVHAMPSISSMLQQPLGAQPTASLLFSRAALPEEKRDLLSVQLASQQTRQRPTLPRLATASTGGRGRGLPSIRTAASDVQETARSMRSVRTDYPGTPMRRLENFTREPSGTPPDSKDQSGSDSEPNSFKPSAYHGGEGATNILGPQPFSYDRGSIRGSVRSPSTRRHELVTRASILTGGRTVASGARASTPENEMPFSPTSATMGLPQIPRRPSGMLDQVQEVPTRSPTPEELANEVIAQRVQEFLPSFGVLQPKERAKLEMVLTALVKEYPTLRMEATRPQAAVSASGTDLSPDAPPVPATAATEVLFIDKDRTIKVNPAAMQESIVALSLAASQAKLARWEKQHQPDFDSVREAYSTIQQVNQLKKEGTISRAQKAAAYDRAADLLRRGIGIDDETWESAKADIRHMGRLDASDGLLHLAMLGGFAGLVGGADIPAGLKSYGKYGMTALSNTFLNAFSQVVLNAFEDDATRNHGVPAMASNISGSTRLMDLSPSMMTTIREVRDALDAINGNSGDKELKTKLEALGKALEKHMADYRMKMASSRTYMEKYRRTLPYRALVAMPSSIALSAASAKIPFAIPVAYGLTVFHQAVIIALAGKDEVTKMKHIIRSNAKYGNYIKTDKDGLPVVNGEGVPEVDESVIRAMWSHPIDKVQTEVSMVYTERLAKLYRKLNKAEKELSESGKNAKKREKFQALVEGHKKKIESLQEDIIRFTEGVDAIRTNKRGVDWSGLNPDGLIAQMLTSRPKYIQEMTKVRLNRPGEFMSELGDRVYGTAALRMMGMGIEDGARAEDVLAPGTQALVQSGALASATFSNPTAKYFKAMFARARYFKAAPPDGATIPRGSFYGRRYATQGSFKSHVELKITGRDTPLRVDFTKTDAWAKHTNSWAFRNINSAVTFVANVAQNSGEIIATPAALRTASKRYATARTLRDEIAQKLRTNAAAADQQAAADEREAVEGMMKAVSAHLEQTAAKTSEVFQSIGRDIKETAEMLAYHARLREVDTSFLAGADGERPSVAGETDLAGEPEKRTIERPEAAQATGEAVVAGAAENGSGAPLSKRVVERARSMLKTLEVSLGVIPESQDPSPNTPVAQSEFSFGLPVVDEETGENRWSEHLLSALEQLGETMEGSVLQAASSVPREDMPEVLPTAARVTATGTAESDSARQPASGSTRTVSIDHPARG